MVIVPGPREDRWASGNNCKVAGFAVAGLFPAPSCSPAASAAASTGDSQSSNYTTFKRGDSPIYLYRNQFQSHLKPPFWLPYCEETESAGKTQRRKLSDPQIQWGESKCTSGSVCSLIILWFVFFFPLPFPLMISLTLLPFSLLVNILSLPFLFLILSPLCSL